MLEQLKKELKAFEALDVLSFSQFENSIWATNGHFIIKFPEKERLDLKDKKFFYETTCTDCDERKKKCNRQSVRKACPLVKEAEFFGKRTNCDSVPIIKAARYAIEKLQFKFADSEEKIKSVVFYCERYENYIPFAKRYLQLFKKFYKKIVIYSDGRNNSPAYIKTGESLIGVLIPLTADQQQLEEKAKQQSEAKARKPKEPK